MVVLRDLPKHRGGLLLGQPWVSQTLVERHDSSTPTSSRHPTPGYVDLFPTPVLTTLFDCWGSGRKEWNHLLLVTTQSRPSVVGEIGGRKGDPSGDEAVVDRTVPVDRPTRLGVGRETSPRVSECRGSPEGGSGGPVPRPNPRQTCINSDLVTKGWFPLKRRGPCKPLETSIKIKRTIYIYIKINFTLIKCIVL